MAKRKTTKQASKQTQKPKRGPLPKLPITISASIVWLPMEAMRMPLFGDSEETKQWLMNALLDAHNKYHAPIIRQWEQFQAKQRAGREKGNAKQKQAARQRGLRVVQLVEDHSREVTKLDNAFQPVANRLNNELKEESERRKKAGKNDDAKPEKPYTKASVKRLYYMYLSEWQITQENS
jgi:hypothetical protein